jgi:biopolymer transport protein ExbB/TolQ
MFRVFAYTGRTFSLLLGALFIAGSYVIIDRCAFFLCYGLLSGRLRHGPSDKGASHIYAAFLKAAREFRATSAEGVYSDEIIDHAREVALRDAVDGQEIDWGRGWLEFLGTIAPAVGFMGTLVGLIASFTELRLGADLSVVLEGLALSMTTSLLGVMISVLFLSTAWILGRIRQRLDGTLYRLIANAQETDRLGG